MTAATTLKLLVVVTFFIWDGQRRLVSRGRLTKIRRRALWTGVVAAWIACLVWYGIDSSAPQKFLMAVERGDVHEVRALYKLDNTLVDATKIGLGGETALQLAVVRGDTKMLKTLLELGADPDIASDGVRALHLAARSGNVDAVVLLLDAGADVDALGFRHKESALAIASSFGKLEVVRALLARKADPCLRSEYSQKSAADLAREHAHTEILELLSKFSCGKFYPMSTSGTK